jgi:hypothetical protein
MNFKIHFKNMTQRPKLVHPLAMSQNLRLELQNILDLEMIQGQASTVS